MRRTFFRFRVNRYRQEISEFFFYTIYQILIISTTSGHEHLITFTKIIICKRFFQTRRDNIIVVHSQYLLTQICYIMPNSIYCNPTFLEQDIQLMLCLQIQIKLLG